MTSAPLTPHSVRSSLSTGPPATARGEPGVYRRAVSGLDRLLVTAALKKTNGQHAAAAELLGISRPTLRAKLRAEPPPKPGGED